MERYIIQAPNQLLTTKCKKIFDYNLANDISKKMIEIAYRIRSTIYQYPRGFEMAAPQVGELYRIIILQGEYHLDPKAINTIVMLNPEILNESDLFYNWEDCLSVNSMRGYVKRCGCLRVRFQRLDKKQHQREFQGNIACDIQHGIDHLNGKLFFERDMKYFIPLKVYRPLKDQNIEVLNNFVKKSYQIFNPNQFFSISEMKKFGLIHPRQCLPI